MAAETGVTMTRDGVRQRTRVWRPSGARRGVIVLVHGIAEHTGRYERTGRLLAEAGFEVRAHDQRGHGLTEGARGYVRSFDLFLDDVEDHVKRAREGGAKVALLGHSMGGLVSARYAVSDRPQPDALVLCAPALDANVPGWQRVAAPILSVVLPKLRLATPVAGEQLSRDPEVGRGYFADPLVQTSASGRLGGECFRAMEETRLALARLRVPTFVIHGGDDTLVPTRFSAPLADLPGVTRKVYPELRHELFNEPEGPEVVADVVDFLRRALGEAS